MQHKPQTIPQAMIDIVKERMLAYTYSLSKLENFERHKRSLQPHQQQFPLSLPSVSNSSAHLIAIATPSVLVTHSLLPVNFSLLDPIQPSCNIFPFQHLQYMAQATVVCIATLHYIEAFSLIRLTPTMQSICLVCKFNECKVYISGLCKH